MREEPVGHVNVFCPYCREDHYVGVGFVYEDEMERLYYLCGRVGRSFEPAQEREGPNKCNPPGEARQKKHRSWR